MNGKKDWQNQQKTKRNKQNKKIQLEKSVGVDWLVG